MTDIRKRHLWIALGFIGGAIATGFFGALGATLFDSVKEAAKEPLHILIFTSVALAAMGIATIAYYLNKRNSRR